MIELVKAEDVCSFVDGTSFGVALLFMAWNSLKCVDWAAMSPDMTSQVFLFVVQTGTVFIFPEEAIAWVVHSDRAGFVAQALFEILFSLLFPPLFFICRQAD